MLHRVAQRRGAAKAVVENGLASAAMVSSESCFRLPAKTLNPLLSVYTYKAAQY